MKAQISHSTIKFLLVLMFYLVGVLFYELIAKVFDFTYTDEILASLIFVYFLFYGNKREKEFYVCLAFFFFYLAYLLLFPHNIKRAIASDFIMQIKPYIVFYGVLALRITLSARQKKVLRNLCVVVSLFLLFPAGLLGVDRWQSDFFGHYSRFATACVVTGMLYYYSSSHDKKSVIITFFIWALSIFSLRSKAFGFCALASCLFFLWRETDELKRIFSFTNVVLISLMVGVSVFVAWEKISYYFVLGTEDEVNMMARPILYIGAVEILKDYPFFGTGFGSYATYASELYWSPLYMQYKLVYFSYDIMMHQFVSDVWFPALAEFGLVGIGFFCAFWYKRLKEGNRSSQIIKDIIPFRMTILVAAFFFMESVADSTITHNRGAMVFFILAMFINESRREVAEIERKKEREKVEE